MQATECDGFQDVYVARTGFAEPAIPIPAPPAFPTTGSTDQELVQFCLVGDQRAWALLIGRYKNLIYSFPRRYGARAADAADVFQMVCAELFRALPQLRNHQSLRAWIMTVASHQAYHWKRRYVQRVRVEGDDCELTSDPHAIAPSEVLEQSERDRVVREAIAQLPPRCREIVKMLFYQDPPVPYQTLAGHLGLATGSIGLTRSRCLKRLEKMLEEVGVRQ